ncbi:MAG: sigma-70 family RNA polymerase sigma factor [Planctomycetales bacterium]|nr:sigma-70 family RNA polymerase sigma factor [Planctomycetales bacterium]
MPHASDLFRRIQSGDPQAAAELLPLVYDELRRLAKARLSSERAGQTFQATDLVHEAYRKLVDTKDGGGENWKSEGHFFGAAAQAMRRILIDRAREKAARKRGGDLQRVEFDGIEHPASERPEELLQLDAALDQLEKCDPQKAELVKLRFFAGLTNKQAAKSLGISPATADRQWAFARAWLKTEMKRGSAAQ